MHIIVIIYNIIYYTQYSISSLHIQHAHNYSLKITNILFNNYYAIYAVIEVSDKISKQV